MWIYSIGYFITLGKWYNLTYNLEMGKKCLTLNNLYFSKLYCWFDIFPSNVLDQSKSNDICMGFMTTVENISAKAQINNVEVKYFAFDVQYSYQPKRVLCEIDRNMQTVDMMLICRGGTGIVYPCVFDKNRKWCSRKSCLVKTINLQIILKKLCL